MADNDNLSLPEGLSDTLASILSNPELMSKISGILDSGSQDDNAVPKESEPPTGNSIGNALSDPALMAKLPEVISVLRPMLENGEKKGEPPKSGGSSAGNKRMALLYALKPYLSPRRCEAIEYFARISKMGDMIKNIKP